MNKQLQKELDESLKRYCSEGDFKQVQLLISQGADIHTEDDVALKLSTNNGHLKVVKHLIENGANIHVENDYALRYSASNGHLEVVKYLIEQGANIHAKNDRCLKRCAREGYLEVVELLFNKYNAHNKQKLAINIIKNNASEELIKFFSAKILADKLDGDLKKHNIITKKIKI